ncbi:MAG: hypothetical protein WCP77_02505 [Roseococcus sp.]
MRLVGRALGLYLRRGKYRRGACASHPNPAATARKRAGLVSIPSEMQAAISTGVGG